MKAGQVCKRDVVSASFGTSLAEAARLMRENHVGSIVVLDASRPRRPAGIVTDRDIVVEVVAPGLDAAGITVGEVMGRALAVVREDDDALAALKLMRRQGVRRLPVVDAQGDLAGILSLDDLLEVGANALSDVAQAIASEQAIEGWRRA